MAKKDVSKGITKVKPQLELPDFMADEEVLGLETLKEFIVPPFIKIVQKQAGEELLKNFSAGDVILSPANAMIAEMPRDTKGHVLEGATSSFLFTPILFYPEWITWNPIELKGQEPAIRYRTTDPSDRLVAKARDPQLRSEPHPSDQSGMLKIRHCEHLNFIVILSNHALGETPAIISFARGEWKSGSNFASLIKMRKAPIYGCVFEATVNMRHGTKGEWYGFDIVNSDERAWVEKDSYAIFKTLHEEFDKAHKEARIKAQYDSQPGEVDPAAVAGKEEF